MLVSKVSYIQYWYAHQSADSQRLTDIGIIDTKKDINTYIDPQFSSGLSCCGIPRAQDGITIPAAAKSTANLNDFVGSFQIYAIKA